MKKKITIRKRESKDDDRLVRIWGSAVRATHFFLQPGDVEFYRPFVERSLAALDVRVAAEENGTPLAFIGLDGRHVEMLFVDPAYAGRGIGGKLLDLAFTESAVDSVDVNEQNVQALGFYRKKGFTVVGRDETDPSGKPYPILHLRK